MDEREKALALFSSMRGQYIISQALFLAHRELKDAEPSNAADMKLLHDELFPIFNDYLFSAMTAAHKQKG